MRFLQIHNFYLHYIHQFYQKRPSLSSKSYDFQNKALIRDFFSGIHIVAPYMDKVGYDSRLIIANCNYAQLQWAKENGIPCDGSLSLNDLLFLQIQDFDPDIIYFTDSIGFDSKFIRNLKKRPRLILGWRAALIPEGTDWSEFDIILSNMEHIREAAPLFGAKAAEKFYPGMPLWVINSLKNINKTIDVGFSGQYTLKQHEERNKYLDVLARASGQLGFTCALHLSGETRSTTTAIKKIQSPALYGMDMHKMLAGSRIAFDGRGKIFMFNSMTGREIDLGAKTTGNMRIFEATGSGVFLLTQHFENLFEIFDVGKEIVTFENEKDLVDKIKFYLHHSDEREIIADRGLNRCAKDHSMENRVVELDGIIKKYLNLPNSYE